MAHNNGAAGNLNVSGGAATFKDSYIGRKGLGVFTQTGGAVTNTGILRLGTLNAAGDGRYNVNGGTNIMGNAEVGDYSGAEGSITVGVSSNAYLKANRIYLGSAAGGTGTLTVNDGIAQTSFLHMNTDPTANSTATLNGGRCQVSVLEVDSNNDSIHFEGGIMWLRQTGEGDVNLPMENINQIDALISNGVVTWAISPIGTGNDPETADFAWTNGSSVILYGDTNGPNYTVFWAEATLPIPTYSDWTADYSLTGTDTNLMANPDGDSFDNLAEYGLGGNPTNANDVGLTSTGSELDSGTNWFIYVYNRRTDYADRSLAYDVHNRNDLVFGSWLDEYEKAIGVSASFTGSLGDTFESVTNRISMDSETKEFTQLEITISE
jgi:hypothetical protein